MTLYKNKYRIESARKPGWDYSTPGFYFITVCTHYRRCLFGHIADGKMVLNDFGRIVQNEWDRSFIIRRELLRDEFMVMPNHFHGIVRLIDIGKTLGRTTNGGGTTNGVGGSGAVETPGRASLQEPLPQPISIIRPKSVSSFMAGVKSVITKQINLKNSVEN